MGCTAKSTFHTARLMTDHNSTQTGNGTFGFINLCFHVNHLHKVIAACSNGNETFSQLCGNRIFALHNNIVH